MFMLISFSALLVPLYKIQWPLAVAVASGTTFIEAR